MDLPMPMRFRHLKKTSKEAVGVYRYGVLEDSRKPVLFSCGVCAPPRQLGLEVTFIGPEPCSPHTERCT